MKQQITTYNVEHLVYSLYSCQMCFSNRKWWRVCFLQIAESAHFLSISWLSYFAAAKACWERRLYCRNCSLKNLSFQGSQKRIATGWQTDVKRINHQSFAILCPSVCYPLAISSMLPIYYCYPFARSNPFAAILSGFIGLWCMQCFYLNIVFCCCRPRHSHISYVLSQRNVLRPSGTTRVAITCIATIIECTCST